MLTITRGVYDDLMQAQACIMTLKDGRFLRRGGAMNEHERHILFPVMFLVIFVVSVHFFAGVSAASAIIVNLQVDTTAVNPGDTVSVSLALDSFPNLTRFGPIEIQFDSSSVSFIGLDRGSDIPSTFNIDHTASTSVIVITGTDETVEAQILANQTASTTTQREIRSLRPRSVDDC